MIKSYFIMAVLAVFSTGNAIMSDEATPPSLNSASCDTKELPKMEKARNVDVTLRIDPYIYPLKEGEAPKFDPVLNRENLIAIKQFILKQGQKETYCQMFNNNPYFGIGRYRFYLIPDPGPDGRPQFNGECDPQKTDFHTLRIQNRDSGTSLFQDCEIQFIDEYIIYITVNWPANDLEVGVLRSNVEEALKVILEEMKRLKTSNQIRRENLPPLLNNDALMKSFSQ